MNRAEEHSFRNRFGERLYFPEAYQGAPAEVREAYERGRRYGHWEVDNAISWHVTCMRCASNLDQRIAGHFDGERGGLAEALAVVQRYAEENPKEAATATAIKNKIGALLAAYDPPPPRVDPCTEQRAF